VKTQDLKRAFLQEVALLFTSSRQFRVLGFHSFLLRFICG